MEKGEWKSISTLSSHSYACGYCGESLSSNVGYFSKDGYGVMQGKIYICHACNKPTYFTAADKQTPGSLLGASVEHLPGDIRSVYDEIRKATTVGSYTAAVLSARKLLMHIAVELGAKVGLTFAQYVDYLVDNHYTPPKSKAWVDRIRKAGNEANHEIVIMDVERATSIIKLVEMLLKFNYEFPAEASEEEEGKE